MKSMHKLLKRKKSKLGTAAKILIPVAGVIAGKKLWDHKDALIPDCVRAKVLEKTEAVQDKVQKFHDFVQDSDSKSEESLFEDDAITETTNVTPYEMKEKTAEEVSEIMEEYDFKTKKEETETEESEKDSSVD